MSDEPGISLREHFEALITEAKALFSQRMNDADKAVDKALGSVEKSTTRADMLIDSLRKELSDQIRQYPTRAEHDVLAKDITSLTTRVTSMEGRGTGLKDGWGYLVGLAGLAAGAWALITGKH